MFEEYSKKIIEKNNVPRDINALNIPNNKKTNSQVPK